MVKVELNFMYFLKHERSAAYLLRDHSFNTYARFSEKQTFLTP